MEIRTALGRRLSNVGKNAKRSSLFRLPNFEGFMSPSLRVFVEHVDD